MSDPIWETGKGWVRADPEHLITDRIEIPCREIHIMEYIGPRAAVWIGVVCRTHKWECGHRHTRWGPVARCLHRHVVSVEEEE